MSDLLSSHEVHSVDAVLGIFTRSMYLILYMLVVDNTKQGVTLMAVLLSGTNRTFIEKVDFISNISSVQAHFLAYTYAIQYNIHFLRW